MAIFWLPFSYILLILVFFWIHFGTLDTVKNIFGHWCYYIIIIIIIIISNLFNVDHKYYKKIAHKINK